MPRYRIRKARLVGCAGAVFLLQTAVLHRFSPGWGRPDLICLLAAFLALEATPAGALWSGLGLGLVRDLGSGGPLGGSALALLPVVALMLLVRDRPYRGAGMDVALALGFVLGFSVLEAAGALIHAPAAGPAHLLRVAVGQSLLSAAVAFPLFFLFQHIGVVRAGRGGFGP